MHSFKNDYTELAHPRILQAIQAFNLEQAEAYGEDGHSAAARDFIRQRLGKPGQAAEIHFLCGGTQTNLTAIAAFLRAHEAVIAADTAHICVHEAGAVEAAGHKIITVPGNNGKLPPEALREILAAHTDEHMAKPRLVKISQTTELGTIYDRAELAALSQLCRERNLLLYVDGARLGPALAAEGCDLSLADLCALTDAFYIGGTKNGALLGEALVIVNDALKPDFRWHIKQRGGMLAKGRLLGIQFEELFRDELFLELARHANHMAQALARGLAGAGYPFLVPSPSNQIFPILPHRLIAELKQNWDFSVWRDLGNGQAALRLVTSWATPAQAVSAFVQQCAAAAR